MCVNSIACFFCWLAVVWLICWLFHTVISVSEQMIDSSGNFTSPEVQSYSNITTHTSSSTDGLRIVVLCFNLLSGVPTYSYVMWLIIRGTNGIASEFFNFNLNVCEMFFSLSSLAFLLSQMSPVFVTIQRLSLGLAITIRPLFQCLICVERYLAVIHPVTFLKYKPIRYKIVCSVVVWLLGVGSCLFSLFILLSNNIIAFTWFVLLQFFLFLFIQLFCCLAVLRGLKRSGPGERKKEEENDMKRKAFYLILITTVTMVIIYAPFIISHSVFWYNKIIQFCLLV